MFDKILKAFLSRFLVALLNFLMVIVTAKQLGADGRGVISLIVLALTINQLLSGMVGGTALIYLAPRKPVFQLLIPSYIWALLSSLLGTWIMGIFNLMPAQFAIDIILLSVLQTVGNSHLNLFIGQEKTKQFNIISALQVLISLIALLMLFYLFNDKSIKAFIVSQYLGLGYVLVASSAIIFKDIKTTALKGWRNVMQAILQNSFYIQIASLVHLLNCRLSYYMLDRYMGKYSLGVYSTAVSIAESLWLISRSIVMIQYSKVVNSTELIASRKLTLQLAKFSLLITLACACILLLLPAGFFTWLFGKDFSGIKHLLIYLLPGVAFIANTNLYTHYYAGIGKNHINTIGSLIGFVFTLISCTLLIPTYHLTGAAVSSCISYFANSVFLIFLFKKESGYSWKDFLISRSEIKFGIASAKNFITRGQHF